MVGFGKQAGIISEDRVMDDFKTLWADIRKNWKWFLVWAAIMLAFVFGVMT